MSLEIFQVDAFADRPYVGNPAAVVLLTGPREEAWMQSVAQEMNLSETAFVHPEGDAFRLRWFTPAVEVELCGHATLATAHVLWETGRLAPGAAARFNTASGLLTAEQRGAWIELDFPAKPALAVDDPPPGLASALGAEPGFIGKSRFDYFLELATVDAVRSLAPDFTRLRSQPVRGVIVTARGDGAPYDFVSRFFAPGSGIDEDPVTGSAHCTLAPYWAGKLGKDEMLAYQASARGGVVRVRLAGDRVKLGGQAVTVLAGKLLG
jgi:predicted PhzF superfamily epimerase YddE/YHI9